MPRAGYKAYTISLEPKVHTEFKVECYFNGKEMSDIISNFLVLYTKKSQEARLRNKIK